MTDNALATAGLVSYGIAAIGWLLLAARISVGLSGNRRGALLLGVALATTLWAVAGAWFARTPSWVPLVLLDAANVVRYALWLAFLAALLKTAAGGAAPNAFPRWLTAGVVLLLVLATLLLDGLPPAAALLGSDLRHDFAVQVGLAIASLVVVEHLYRRLHPEARWAVKPLVIALCGVFGYDLYLYADALLFGRVDPDVWIARGAANAIVIPLVAIATARNARWTVEMHLSRAAVFQSTALLVSGVFLLAIAGAGYIIRYLGGDWGRALQIELVFAAIVFVGLLATSGQFRSRVRVFVSKHFFSYRYDYREEWLRFTRTLATDSTVIGVQERAIRALADLVESPGGALWLADERKSLRPAARLNVPAVDFVVAPDAPLAAFLGRTGWIVVLPELARHSERYEDLMLPEWLRAMPGAWLVVPLAVGGELIGFVVLLDPRTPVEIDWEVRDLLKATAHAAAAYLQQLRATEALIESRKFDAFNRMSAFVVHDLKNLVAQLSLMLRNAERHRDNPEFQRDMLQTVAHVVDRMNGLMLQLRAGTTPVENRRPVDLAVLVRRVIAAKPRSDTVDLALEGGVLALGHEERLEHVVGHLLQNALDATQVQGSVRVAVRRDGGDATIEVADTGVGMTPAFVRERLFKPFETTKAAGMGIGVYESQQYVVSLGGRLDVDSGEGRGTRVLVRLPAAEAAGAPQRHAPVEAAPTPGSSAGGGAGRINA